MFTSIRSIYGAVGVVLGAIALAAGGRRALA